MSRSTWPSLRNSSRTTASLPGLSPVTARINEVRAKSERLLAPDWGRYLASRSDSSGEMRNRMRRLRRSFASTSHPYTEALRPRSQRTGTGAAMARVFGRAAVPNAHTRCCAWFGSILPDPLKRLLLPVYLYGAGDSVTAGGPLISGALRTGFGRHLFGRSNRTDPLAVYFHSHRSLK